MIDPPRLHRPRAPIACEREHRAHRSDERLRLTAPPRGWPAHNERRSAPAHGPRMMAGAADTDRAAAQPGTDRRRPTADEPATRRNIAIVHGSLATLHHDLGGVRWLARITLAASLATLAIVLSMVLR